MKLFHSILMLVGRVAISLIFFAAAYHKITHWDAAIYEMAAMGIGQAPIFLFLTCMIEFLGGLSLVLGFKTRWGAAVLALFLIPATIVFHNFWSYSESVDDLQLFLKNLAIFGGLLYVAVSGPGALAIDKR
jgi:putative oxidoreductase